jgi:hypothetical protein
MCIFAWRMIGTVVTVTLGGDGTLLHLADLFSGDGEEGLARPPPVVSFGMGTLGFLTPFDGRYGMVWYGLPVASVSRVSQYGQSETIHFSVPNDGGRPSA